MCRVLLLEDDVEQGMLVAESLRLANGPYQVNFFSTAQDALDELRRSVEDNDPYEILLIDQRLGPGKDGIETLQEMRRICPDADAIIFTGFEDLDDGYRAYEAGAFRYLLKPFRSKELLFLLRSLKQYRQEQREHNWQKIYSQMVEDAVQKDTFHAVAAIVVDYARRIGFDRAHLFWSPKGEEKEQVNCLVGILSEGEGCSLEFGNRLFYYQDWLPFTQAFITRDVRFYNAGDTHLLKRPDIPAAWMSLADFRAPLGEWAILPLWSGSNLLGALLVDFGDREKKIPDHQRPWLDLFARQAAVILERASLYEHEVRSHAEAAVIGNIGRRITTRAALDDLITLLEEVRQQVRELMDVSNFIVVMADEETQHLDFCLHYEANQRVDRHWRLLGEGMAGHLLEQQRTVYVPSNVQGYREERGIPLFGRQAQCWLGVPLRVSDKVIGGIIVQDYHQPGKFKKHDVYLLEAIADQVAGAIQVNRLAEAERQNAERMRVLQRASVELLRIADKDDDDFWLTVLTISTSSFGMRFNRALLFLVENNDRLLRGRMGIGSDQGPEAHANWERDEARGYNFETFLQDLAGGAVEMTPYARAVQDVIIDLQKDAGVFQQVLKSGERQIVLSDEVAYKLPLAFNRGFLFGPCAILPLRSGSQSIGIVVVDNRHDGKPLQGKMLDLLDTLLNNAALIWESLRQRRQREALLQANFAIMGEANRQPLGETLRRICEAAHQVAEADWTIIYPIKPGGNIYEYDRPNISYVGKLKQPIEKVIKEKPRQKGVSAHILRSGRLVVPDIDQDTTVIGRDRLYDSHFIQREEVKALLGIPIRDPLTEEPLGVLYLDYRSPRSFSDLDIRQAESFANLAAIAILGARRFAQERRSAVQYQQREREISRRMLEDALAGKTENEVIKALASNIQLALDPFDVETVLILHSWCSVSVDEDPVEIYQRCTVTTQNNLEILPCSPAERASVARVATEKRTRHHASRKQVYVPVKLADSVLGVLLARGPSNRSIDDAVSVLEKFADVAALALDNIRRQEHLRAVLRAAQAVTAPTDLEQTFQKIVGIGRQVSPDLSALTLWYQDLETGNLYWGRSFGVRNLPAMQSRVRDGVSGGDIVWYVMNATDPIWASDLSLHPELVGRFVHEEEIVSTAAFPLKVDDDVVGAMFFNYRVYHYFTPEERMILTILAEIVGSSIRDAIRLEAERKEKDRLDAALSTAETVGTVLELDDVLVMVLEELRNLLDETRVCVLIYDEDNLALEFARKTLAFYPIQNPDYQPSRLVPLYGRSIASRVARMAIDCRQMVIENVENVREDPDYEQLIPESESELCVSLVSNQRLLGVLVLERPRKHGFNQDDVLLVKGIARQISLAIDRARQNDQLGFKSTVAAATAWAADLAHDINRQVGQINIYAYLARERADYPDEVREYTALIEKSARYLSSAGPWRNPNPEQLAVDTAIGNLVQELRRTIDVEIVFEPGCPGTKIEVNPVAFQRVIRQLTRNAIQAMSQVPQKKLAIYTSLMGNNMVDIQFEDYGPGVNDDVRAAVFQRPISTKSERGGYGLLLSRQMVEDMGGNILLLPQREGVGATFSIRLPVVDVPDSWISAMLSQQG